MHPLLMEQFRKHLFTTNTGQQEVLIYLLFSSWESKTVQSHSLFAWQRLLWPTMMVIMVILWHIFMAYKGIYLIWPNYEEKEEENKWLKRKRLSPKIWGDIAWPFNLYEPLKWKINLTIMVI